MIDIIAILLDIIRLDLLIGFGIYSFLLLVIRPFIKSKVDLSSFDKSVSQIIIYAGIAYGVLFLLYLVIYYFEAFGHEEEFEGWSNSYWHFNLIQTSFWVLLTQSLRIKSLQKSLIYRVMITPLLSLTFEVFIILGSMLHRDYLAAGWWNFDIGILDVAVGLGSKLLILLALSVIYHFRANMIPGFSK